MCQSRNTPVHISETNNAFLNGNSEQPNNNTYCEPGHPLQDSYSAFIPTPPQTPAFRIHENSTPHVVSSQQPYSAFPMQISNGGNSDNKILTVARELNKPKAEIQNFNGNPMDYNRFLRQLNTRICHNTDSYEERLNFLLQFTTGEAHRIVIGYSHLDSERGYNAALKEFRDRYGDTDVIAQSYIKKALDWPIIKTDDAKALDSFSVYLKECQFAIENVEAARLLEYSENLKLLVKKLPYYLHEKWRNIVYDLKEKGQIVKFHHLVNFVCKEAKKATDPIYGRDVMSNAKPTKTSQESQQKKSVKFSGTHKNFAISSNEQSKPDEESTSNGKPKTVSVFSKPCVHCEESYSLDMCKKYLNLPLKDRYSFLKSKGLCFAFLKPGHLKTNCKQRLNCTHCMKKHPTILHVNYQKKEVSRKRSRDDNEATALSVAEHTGAGDSAKQALPIVPVRLKSKNSDKFVTTYAFLDSGSNATFCSENIVHSLNIEGKKSRLNLVTMGQEKVQDTFVIPNLEVSDICGKNTLAPQPVFTQSRLSVARKDVISLDDIKRWPNLHDIDLYVMDC